MTDALDDPSALRQLAGWIDNAVKVNGKARVQFKDGPRAAALVRRAGLRLALLERERVAYQVELIRMRDEIAGLRARIGVEFEQRHEVAH